MKLTKKTHWKKLVMIRSTKNTKFIFSNEIKLILKTIAQSNF